MSFDENRLFKSQLNSLQFPKKALKTSDPVLADRGFDIADNVGIGYAQVNIPSFTKGKSQSSPVDR